MNKWRLDAGQIEVVDEALAKVLRGKEPRERVAMIGQANRTMRALTEGHVRTWHPDWSDERSRARSAGGCSVEQHDRLRPTLDLL